MPFPFHFHSILAAMEVALRAARKRSPLDSVRRARPITPAEMARAARVPKIGDTVRLLWLSASRHGDLPAMSAITWNRGEQTVIQLKFSGHKSDTFGVRAVSKWIPWPQQSAAKVVRNINSRRMASYRTVLKALKQVSPELTVHSIRRGAALCLADRGWSMVDIQLITGHTPTQDPMLAVRRYVDASLAQPEAKKCLAMAQELLLAMTC